MESRSWNGDGEVARRKYGGGLDHGGGLDQRQRLLISGDEHLLFLSGNALGLSPFRGDSVG